MDLFVVIAIVIAHKHAKTMLHCHQHSHGCHQHRPGCHLPHHRGISQLYRSPDTTHLVGALKDQVRELRAARDQLADEMLSLQKSTRATRTAELQSELAMAHMELDRLARINQVRGCHRIYIYSIYIEYIE